MQFGEPQDAVQSGRQGLIADSREKLLASKLAQDLIGVLALC